MSECQKDISQVVRGAVIDTLKASAPGLSETMRLAIAHSIVLKVQKVFGVSAHPSQQDKTP